MESSAEVCGDAQGGSQGGERGGGDPLGLGDVRCFVLGDGKTPMGAAALALRLPPTWRFVSIDPLAEEAFTRVAGAPALGAYAKRIEVFAGLSQEYPIRDMFGANRGGAFMTESQTPPEKAMGDAGEQDQGDRGASTAASRPLSVVVACHSHAPLAEFWSRVPAPKIAITMACCADYSDLAAETPVIEFDDYEVYSPKRRVKIYITDSIVHECSNDTHIERIHTGP